MYALKQAVLLRHSIHDVEVTLYSMDIRAFGKGYEQFYRRAVREGVRVVKGKVAKLQEAEGHDLLLRVERIDVDGRIEEHRYDLVVLAQGLVPAWHAAGVVDIEEAEDGFVETPELKINPSFTTVEGIFVAGVAAGPKDIPDAIVEAGEAAMAAANHLERIRWRAGPVRAAEDEGEEGEEPGVELAGQASGGRWA
jgi:heterodisulfide reductase subunit A